MIELFNWIVGSHSHLQMRKLSFMFVSDWLAISLSFLNKIKTSLVIKKKVKKSKKKVKNKKKIKIN